MTYLAPFGSPGNQTLRLQQLIFLGFGPEDHTMQCFCPVVSPRETADSRKALGVELAAFAFLRDPPGTGSSSPAQLLFVGGVPFLIYRIHVVYT